MHITAAKIMQLYTSIERSSISAHYRVWSGDVDSCSLCECPNTN